jgi:G3E family GTPase
MLHRRLHACNPRAPVQAVRQGRADLAHVFDTGAFDLGVMLSLEPRLFQQPARERRAQAMSPCRDAASEPREQPGLHH